jgi:CPA1 family monovalent cation:H+ antiporter
LYWIAEQLHSSGVLAVVSGGLFLANRRFEFLSGESRVRGYSFWEAFIFILNGIVFMLIGLELPEIVTGLRKEGIPLSTAINYGILVTVILIITRIISSYAAIVATLIFRPSVAPSRRSNGRLWKLPLLLGWTGMRGVVSLAAALAIPITINDQPFPHRNLILFITFLVILLTLLVQGLTLPYFIKRSKLFDNQDEVPEEKQKSKIKNELAVYTINFLKEKQQQGLFLNKRLVQMLEQWETKIHQPEDSKMNSGAKKNYLEVLNNQRNFVAALNKDGQYDEAIIRWQINQIDLEEERIKLM